MAVASTPATVRPIIEEVASSAEPMARSVTPLAIVRSLAVLPGAYNPPTKAHLALATAALERAFDTVAFSVGTVTIDKPGIVDIEDHIADVVVVQLQVS